LFQGDMVAAHDSFTDAAQTAHDAGEVYFEAVSLGYLGWIAREGGRPDDALEPAKQSRALLRQLTDPWERSEVLLALSTAETDELAVTADEVLALKRATGDVIAT